MSKHQFPLLDIVFHNSLCNKVEPSNFMKNKLVNLQEVFFLHILRWKQERMKFLISTFPVEN
jgi:hypothetical protein